MIRLATKEDVKGIKMLAAQYEMEVHGKVKDRTLAEINKIANINGSTYVYESAKSLQGFVTVETDTPVAPVAKGQDNLLRLIVVDRGARKRGIGDKLMRHVIERYCGRCSLMIERKHPEWEKLIRYYEKYGFKVSKIDDRSIKMRLTKS